MMNARVHSSTGLPPRDVTFANAAAVFHKLHPYLSKGQQPPSGRVPEFEINDLVRVISPPALFLKGDQPRASEEPYRISRILLHPVVRYKLKDIHTGNEIIGSYSKREIVKITEIE